jgi:hypothetical protein
MMVNVGRPFSPVRGWIQQQVIIAGRNRSIGGRCGPDSDVEFVRPFTAEIFVREGMVRFFRNPDRIDKQLSLHMTWHRVAHELLARKRDGRAAASGPTPVAT